MKTGQPKLLVVVTGNELSKELADYALTVAVRLDLEVIVLFVNEQCNGLEKESRRREILRFEAEIEKKASEFASLAWTSNIKVTTIVDVNEKEMAIRRAREQEPDIRFILYDEPDHSDQGETTDKPPRLQVLRTPEPGASGQV